MIVSGTFPFTIAWARPDDGGLADTGLADKDRIVLRAARKDLHDAFHFGSAPDHGVEFVFACSLGEITTELFEDRRVLTFGSACAANSGADGFSAFAFAALVAREELDDGLTDLRQVGTEFGQNLGGNALALFEQAEEEVLGPNVVVAELEGFTQGKFEDALRPWSEGDVALDGFLALTDNLDDAGADRIAFDLRHFKGFRGDSLTLGDEAEEEVLGPDVVVLEAARLILGEDDDPPGAVGEPFEHVTSLLGARVRAHTGSNEPPPPYGLVLELRA